MIDLTGDTDESPSGSEEGRRRSTLIRPILDLTEVEDDDAEDVMTVDDSQSLSSSSDDVEILRVQPREEVVDVESHVRRMHTAVAQSRERVLQLQRRQAEQQRQQQESQLQDQIRRAAQYRQLRRQSETQRTGLTTTTLGGLAGLLGLPRVFDFAGTRNRHEGNLGNMLNAGLDVMDDINLQQASNFNPPDLDFETIGFELGTNNTGETVTRPRPTYETPPTPPQGFTRTPAEDDVLVCPNCDSELGQGDDDVKRQVWVIKSCGHVCIPAGF